jgi:hypothetical protein
VKEEIIRRQVSAAKHLYKALSELREHPGTLWNCYADLFGRYYSLPYEALVRLFKHFPSTSILVIRYTLDQPTLPHESNLIFDQLGWPLCPQLGIGLTQDLEFYVSSIPCSIAPFNIQARCTIGSQ